MDQSREERPQRVTLSPRADLDLAEIHLYTTNAHGIEQADRYLDFLGQEMAALPNRIGLASTIDGFPELRLTLVKWPKARYGHRIVFMVLDNELVVVRLLHTSMDMATALNDDTSQ